MHGEIILPTAFYLDIIASAVSQIAQGGVVLENVAIQEAVRMPREGKDVQIIVSPAIGQSESALTGQFRLFTR